MIYTVVALKTQYPGYFEKDVYMFNNQEEAYAYLRRMMRDLVIKGEISEDRIGEMTFYVVGEFDSDTGRFDNFENHVAMNVHTMCWDLLSDDDSNIPFIGDENA